MPKFGGNLPKLGKLMEALILEGVIQVAQEAQDVLRGGAAFSIQELGGVLQYWSVLVSIDQ